MSPLAGHHIQVRWVRRRSPNVASVGDEMLEIYDPPLPSGTTVGDRYRVMRVYEAGGRRGGLMLIAEPTDEAVRNRRMAMLATNDATILFKASEVRA